MAKESSFLFKAGPLLLILFIDGMGLGLVFPILNGLIFDKNSTFLGNSPLSPLMHTVIYGMIISIFMLCWFFGAAILGDLSDKIGRKKSLIICLTGACFSYLVSAIAVELHSLLLLIFGRIISGVTSGSQPIAQAAIIDISHEEHKTRNIGYILLALSLGFILGPLLGGVLADKNFVSWFTFATPFYFAALISFINIILLLIIFKETYNSKNTTFKINPYQAISIFISAFKDDSVRMLSIIFFVFIFGWSSFYSFIALFLLKKYDFMPTEVSYFMALMGIGFGISNGFLVNMLAKRFTLSANFKVGSVLTAALIFVMLMLDKELICWILTPFIAAAVAVAYPSILTLFSNNVAADKQGWVMGITGSIMALVFSIDGIIVGLIAAFNATAPLYIAAVSLLFSVLIMMIYFKETKKNTRTNESSALRNLCQERKRI